MAIRAIVDLNTADYAAYTGGAIGFSVTEKQAAIINTVLSLTMFREAWQEMSDSEWNALEAELSELIGLFNA